MNILSRRGLLSTSALGLAAVGLAGCQSSTSPATPTPSTLATQVFPAYHAAEAVTPDAPTPDGGMALYLNYPESPKPFIAGAPGAGGTVTAFVDLNGAVPPVPADKNPRWAELNQRLNVDLRFDPVPSDGYAAKLASIVAGGQLPDLVQLKPNTLQRLPEVLDQVFTDLTEHLAGEAVTDYPALANIPTLSWRGGIQNGKIYAVPQPRGLLANALLIRQDLFESKGLSTTPESGEEFLDSCKEFTDERNNKWAISNGPGLLTLLHQMHGAPNNWDFDGDTVTHMYETEQFRQSLSSAAEIAKSGVMHPDAWSAALTTASTWFFNEAAPIMAGVNWGNIFAYTRLDAGQTEGLKVGLIGPVGMAGNTPTYWTGPGFWGFTAIPKAEPDRVEELLRIINYIAAPFGSEEWLFMNYGQADVDYTVDDTNPIPTDNAVTSRLPSASITAAPQVMYQAGLDDVMKRAHAYQDLWLTPQLQSVDPSVQYYSGEAMQSGLGLTNQMTQLAQDIAQGRKTLMDWDEGVQYWRDNGGDKIRDEYRAALQA